MLPGVLLLVPIKNLLLPRPFEIDVFIISGLPSPFRSSTSKPAVLEAFSTVSSMMSGLKESAPPEEVFFNN